MKDLMVKRNFLNKDIIDKIAIEKKIKDIFDQFNNRVPTEAAVKGKGAKTEKNELDVNEMTNVLEKAKTILPSNDKRLEELFNIIEIRKEEIANLAAAKGKNKKK